MKNKYLLNLKINKNSFLYPNFFHFYCLILLGFWLFKCLSIKIKIKTNRKKINYSHNLHLIPHKKVIFLNLPEVLNFFWSSFSNCPCSGKPWRRRGTRSINNINFYLTIFTRGKLLIFCSMLQPKCTNST